LSRPDAPARLATSSASVRRQPVPVGGDSLFDLDAMWSYKTQQWSHKK
jgi:hypothetical protein